MMRTYLVVIDDSPEARVALRFAARRAAKTGGGVEVLAVVEPQDFVQWGGVQAAFEEEQRLRIEAIVTLLGRRNHRRFRDRRPKSRPPGRAGRRRCASISGRAKTSPLWCSARRRRGHPGPLVAHFTGNDAGKLPCPVMIIPGSLTDERLELAELQPRSRREYCPQAATHRHPLHLQRRTAPARAVEVEHGDQLAIAHHRHDQLAVRRESQAIWPGKAWTSSTRWTCMLRRRRAAHALCRTGCGCTPGCPGTARAPVRRRRCGKTRPS